jgi:hypothetical protein
LDLIKQDVIRTIMDYLEKTGQWEQYLEGLVHKKTDPYSISEMIVDRYLNQCKT